METIIKYDNRKHYSKAISQYVNIDYIADLEATGQRFEVVTKDGRDVTEKSVTSAVTKTLTNAVKNGKIGRSELKDILTKLR